MEEKKAVQKAKPQKGRALLRPPEGKNPQLAQAALLVIMGLSVLSAVLTFLWDVDVLVDLRENPVYIVLVILQVSCCVLLQLQYMLGLLRPYKGCLAVLLLLSLAANLVSSGYASLMGTAEGLSIMDNDFGLAGAARTLAMALIVFSLLASLALSPELTMFIGALAKKRSEKIAAMLAALGVLSSLMSIPVMLLANTLSTDPAPGTLWTSTLPKLLSGICVCVFYYTWPALEKPVSSEE